MRIMIDEVLVVADQIRTNQLHGLDWAHQLSLEQAKLISDSEPEQPTKSANPSGEQRSPCTEDAHITIGGSQANSRNTPVVPNASRNEQIRYSIYRRCGCHNLFTFKSPGVLSNVLGALYIESCGRWSRTGASTTCRCQSGFAAYVNYTCPSWLSTCLLEIFLAASMSQDLHFTLTVNAVVPNGSQIFNLARLDDGEGLQQLFNSGAARPNDIIQEGGYSALVVGTSPFLRVKEYSISAGRIQSGA